MDYGRALVRIFGRSDGRKSVGGEDVRDTVIVEVPDTKDDCAMADRTATRPLWVAVLVAVVGMLKIRRYRYGLYLVILLCANNIVEMMPVETAGQQTLSIVGVAALGAVLLDMLIETLVRFVVLPMWRSLMRWLDDDGEE